MKYLSLVVFILAQPFAAAQDFDGICYLTANGKSWSGVAISDKIVLSVAHHGETGEVRVEFPEGRHGAFNRLSVKARVIKADRRKDLSVLSYEAPAWATIESYPITELPDRAVIRGFVQGNPLELDCRVIGRQTMIDGYVCNTLRGKATQGMSGSPLVVDGGTAGIQIGGTSTTIDAVSAETIRLFLEGL